jgi:formylglycine-generating enzyme required for sulfatase activity
MKHHDTVFKISQAFYMGRYAVTQTQWSMMMDNNPSEFKDGHRPVERVSWNDVQVFIQRLNTKDETDKYRLPTEAEWGYAARAGSQCSYTFGSDTGRLSQYAAYRNNSGGETHQ